MEPGIYDCTVIDARLANSQTGTLNVTLRVALETGQDRPEEMLGYIYLTDRSMNMARQQLKAFGFDIDARELGDIDAGALVGAKTTAQVAVENYRGKDSLKITRFGAAPKPRADQVAKAQAALRAAKSKGKVGAGFGPLPKKPPPPAPEPDEPPPSEDEAAGDIPF